ncbi:unnamed protein product [Rodentolepis nana]|uniref:Aha1_N domain-containing protein n=1 Tax=Rodentolepis nana TaxID=102285 RepID=A0A0R3TN72_RODNA|nr:unnamed protein product [Rodentolepis nana]
MAKWGEGDPRWIVEERADAKNVNNWHWTEKNAGPWSKEKIKALFTGFTLDSNKYFVEITEVSKCEGDAVANNRKGKLITFYEWDVELQWKGRKKETNNASETKGTITCVNLSEENTADELEFEVTCSSNNSEGNEIKEHIRKDGVNFLRKQFAIYINELRTEYSKDLILPTKPAQLDSVNPKEKTTDKNLSEALRKSEILSSKKESAKNDTGKTVQISIQEDFMCTPNDLYRVFVTEELTKHFTRDNATVQATPGGKYSIFNGNVSGNFIELEENKMISMSWRKSNWPEGHMSLLKLEFDRNETGTRLKVTQSNVPTNDKEGTKTGWNTHYFLPIQQTFGFGGKIF